MLSKQRRLFLYLGLVSAHMFCVQAYVDSFGVR